ncbi:retrovirus-related Pol polyprotein from transposon opus [Trichonephila clavipes]|uniref:Retrovirus-related Pol polyprotein from transposon opus n=1 Tax=Trichonephila clavipes TaxID=2585209 RepID=A0A8X6RTQ0_TRICX|nr:retrovirus-related Pol polyprotein from transposon opus [Trichonephila clavipes]
MLQGGAISPIQPPCSSPVVLTRENNDLPPDSPEAYRFAIYYRKLNAITKYPRYPLPVIDDLITNIPCTGVMSTLDLKNGYFQLTISPKDIENTAFITRNGTFAFLRMSFALSGSAPNFQKAIDILLKPVIGRFVSVYMDDEAPVLQLPNFTEQFNLFTDASRVGIGAVLNQNHRPIAFASKTLNKAERNYTVTKRECLAVIWQLNKFKTYLGSLPVKVITDHVVSTKLTNGKNLSSSMITWALKLFEINIKWEHRPGFQNVAADILSRNRVGNMDGSQISCAALRALAINSQKQLIREEGEEPELRHIYRYLENPDDASVNVTVCEGSRKTSSEESNGRKSKKGNAGWEDPRLKRKVGSNGSKDRKDLKRTKFAENVLCRGPNIGTRKDQPLNENRRKNEEFRPRFHLEIINIEDLITPPKEVRPTGVSTTTRRENRRIVWQALVDPTVTRSTKLADVGVAIVPQTISRYLAEANLKFRSPFRAIPLTPEQRQLPLQWYQARSMWNATDWLKVMFSDESRFVLGTDDNRVRVWRRPVERYDSLRTVLRHTARTAGVMFWAALAYDSRSTLIEMRVTLTGQLYVDDILQPHVGSFLNDLPGAIFMQDNAHPHTVRVAQDFLRHFQTLRWPAIFSNLSPVENVWDQLKRQMPSFQSVHDLELPVQDLWAHLPQDNIRCPSTPPTCLPELRKALLDEWCNIPQDQIDNLILSMPRRSKRNIHVFDCIDKNQRDKGFSNILETRLFRDIHVLKLKFRSCTDKRCKASGMMSGEQLDMDAGSFRSYYPYGLNVIWKGESVLLTFKQKSEDSLYIPNFDKSIDNSNNIGLARISRAKRRKRVTRDMSTLKNSMLELAVKFDDNYNTGLIKSFMFDIVDMIKVLQLIYDKYELHTSKKKEKFDILVNLVLKENFIAFDQNLYKQIKGLTQGGQASNCLANLYLHFFEIDHVVNDSYLIYRYIDDLIIFGKNSEYKPNITFYPDYLKLLKTNFNSNRVEFLDLDLHLINNNVVSNIFDKRDSFKFHIIKIPV